MPTSIKSEAETSSIFFWGVFGIVVAEILWGVIVGTMLLLH